MRFIPATTRPDPGAYTTALYKADLLARAGLPVFAEAVPRGRAGGDQAHTRYWYARGAAEALALLDVRGSGAWPTQPFIYRAAAAYVNDPAVRGAFKAAHDLGGVLAVRALALRRFTATAKRTRVPPTEIPE